MVLCDDLSGLVPQISVEGAVCAATMSSGLAPKASRVRVPGRGRSDRWQASRQPASPGCHP